MKCDMSEVAVKLEHVFKKFRKGEIYDSLRDMIPAVTGSFMRGYFKNSLDRQEFWAVEDASFQIARGKAFGIIGPNGAGKSTILKLLSGIMKPTSGLLKVDGRLSALIEVGAGFHPDLTGRENVFLNGVIIGMKRAEISRKLDEIVDFAGLDEFIDTPVKRYSSGMRARLGFSVAAHTDSEVLLIDEVLSVGDYVFQRKCHDRIHEIIRGGATIIFVSHNLKAVADLCDQALLLDRGKIAKIGPTRDVITHYLQQGTGRYASDTGDLQLSMVRVRGRNGESLRFESGDTAWIDVEVTGNVEAKDLAIVIYFQDDESYDVFDTSTQRLGNGTFSLAPGEKFRCTFQLQLHFAEGMYRLGVLVHRYDIQKSFVDKMPAATIFVSSPDDVRGAVNLYPRVTEWGLDEQRPEN